MRTRPILLAAVLVTGLLSIGFLVRVCADGGSMGSAYQTCECRGVEWELYDRMPADGPRRTICVGIVESRACHRFREGPVVACPADRATSER